MPSWQERCSRLAIHVLMRPSADAIGPSAIASWTDLAPLCETSRAGAWRAAPGGVDETRFPPTHNPARGVDGRPKRCCAVRPRGRATPPGAARHAPALLVLDERAEIAPAQGMAQLAERLGLDLPDPLSRDREALAHLFQRVLALLADPEAQAQDFLLLGR